MATLERGNSEGKFIEFWGYAAVVEVVDLFTLVVDADRLLHFEIGLHMTCFSGDNIGRSCSSTQVRKGTCKMRISVANLCCNPPNPPLKSSYIHSLCSEIGYTYLILINWFPSFFLFLFFSFGRSMKEISQWKNKKVCQMQTRLVTIREVLRSIALNKLQDNNIVLRFKVYY